MANEVRLIDAGFAQRIADKELSTEEAGAVQWVLSHTPTIDPESLRPKGRWAHLFGDEWGCTNCGFVISTEGSWEKPTKKFCEDCGAKMEVEG